MSEKEIIYSSKIKSKGYFDFTAFYKFCHGWLSDETGLSIMEDKYVEKLGKDSKEVEIAWSGSKKLTDYFKFKASIKIKVTDLKNVEMKKGDAVINTNQGTIELEIKGILVRDYEGKFELDAFRKFMRNLYEKWIIPSRIEQFEDKVAGNCDEFLAQAKAWLDLEGRK